MHDQGVHVDPSKIQVICDWLTSKTLIKICNFLGLTNFYHSFVLWFSHTTWFLGQVTKGGAKDKYVWAASKHKAIKDLKFCLSSTPVLLLDLQRPFDIEIGSLDYSIGVVLTRHGNSMAYKNESLYDAFHRYPNYYKEIYSIIHECLECKNYIMGKETIIHIDHKPLQFM